MKSRIDLRATARSSGLEHELHLHSLVREDDSSAVRSVQVRTEQAGPHAKHSRAENVDVILERRSDHVLLIVEDDGVGFDPLDESTAPQGFGLLGMQERAALVGATIQIESAVGKGTTVLVRMDAATPSSNPVAHV